MNSQKCLCSFKDYLLEEVNSLNILYCVEWLLFVQILAAPKHSQGDDIQKQASKYLLEFFTSLDAEMVPPPSTDPDIVANIDNPIYREKINPEFFLKVEHVCAKILNECQPKRGYTEGSLMNGKRKLCIMKQNNVMNECTVVEFTEMLKIYVDALNSEDGIPRIGSAWDQAMKNLYEFATSRAKEMYKKVMSSLQFPIEEDEIQKHHQGAYEQSMELFKQLTELDGDRDAYKKNFDELDVSTII